MLQVKSDQGRIGMRNHLKPILNTTRKAKTPEALWG